MVPCRIPTSSILCSNVTCRNTWNLGLEGRRFQRVSQLIPPARGETPTERSIERLASSARIAIWYLASSSHHPSNSQWPSRIETTHSELYLRKYAELQS